MMVSWHEMTILRLDTTILWLNTMIFLDSIILLIRTKKAATGVPVTAIDL